MKFKEGFVFLDHTADIMFQSYGGNLEEAFSNAVLAVSDSITDYKKIEKNVKKEIEKESEDLKALLYDFIDELLYLLDAEKFMAGEVKSIKIKKEKDKYILKAVLLGDDKLDKYEIKTHIKAMTYNDMIIDEKPGSVTLQVVLDI